MDRPAERSPPPSGAGGIPRGRPVRSVRGSVFDPGARVAMGHGGVSVRTWGRRRGPPRRRGGTPGLKSWGGLVAELPSAVSTKYRGLAGRMPHGRLEEGTRTDVGEDGSPAAERIADPERSHESFWRAILPRPSEHDFPERPGWLQRQGQNGIRGCRSCRQPLMTIPCPIIL
jgi:hypothetical protein